MGEITGFQLPFASPGTEISASSVDGEPCRVRRRHEIDFAGTQVVATAASSSSHPEVVVPEKTRDRLTDRRHELHV